MTQAFNLAQFANKVNTSGQVDASTALTNAVPVANGGTGSVTLTANSVLLGNGTTAVQVVAPGTAGNVLTSNGTTWASTAAPGVSSFNTRTGAVTLTNADVLTANSSSAAGAVGTYGVILNLTSYTAGTNYAGSSIGLASGTWKCMSSVSTGSPIGYDTGSGILYTAFYSTTFLRVA